MIDVAGRRVHVRNGGTSQTVNVCTREGRRGVYDWRIRLRAGTVKESDLLIQHFEDVERLVEYLKELGGDVEETPIRVSGTPVHRVAPSMPIDAVDAQWAVTHHAAAERCIDKLASEFVANPYLHRVEHSIHCRLYELLMATPTLSATVLVSGWSTQLVHKEWPEYIVRPEKGNRRGAFDIAVMPPSAIERSSLREFRDGRIRPAIAVELGLDYRANHLRGDIAKLHNSGIEHSYLVHLARQEVPFDPAVERMLLEGGIKGAYVHHFGNRVRFSFVNDSTIREQALG